MHIISFPKRPLGLRSPSYIPSVAKRELMEENQGLAVCKSICCTLSDMALYTQKLSKMLSAAQMQVIFNLRGQSVCVGKVMHVSVRACNNHALFFLSLQNPNK